MVELDAITIHLDPEDNENETKVTQEFSSKTGQINAPISANVSKISRSITKDNPEKTKGIRGKICFNFLDPLIDTVSYVSHYVKL